MSSPNEDPEVSRLASVYRRYEEEPAYIQRWAPTNRGNRRIAIERDRALRTLLGRNGFVPLTSRSILDVGCGSGEALAGFLPLGARPSDLVGVDLLPSRVERARALHPDLRFICADASSLDFPASSLDFVVAFTVFSSILDDAMAQAVSAEIDRVLRAGGGVLWYDIRVANPENPNTRPFGRAAIAALFPGYRLDLRPITLVPQVARRLGPLTRPVYPILAAVPFLRTHYLGLLRKPDA